MPERMTLNVDTGSVIIDVEDKGEKIGEFRFNPADIDIVKRYENVVEYLNSVNFDKEATAEDVMKFTDELKEKFNYLLNYNVAEGLFSKCNPLTPLANGDFYCENVLEGIAGLVETEMGSRIEKKKAKIRRATAKYHT